MRLKCRIKPARSIGMISALLPAIVRSGTRFGGRQTTGVDHTTVIRRVDRLERQLSAKLFDRRKDRLSADRIRSPGASQRRSDGIDHRRQPGPDRGSKAPHRHGPDQRPGRLRHPLPWPRLVKFADLYPDLDIQLVATARLFSLSKREADIAISLALPARGTLSGASWSITASVSTPPSPISHGRRRSKAATTCWRIVCRLHRRAALPPRPNWTICRRSRRRLRRGLLQWQPDRAVQRDTRRFGIAVLPRFMAAGQPGLQADPARQRGLDPAQFLAC